MLFFLLSTATALDFQPCQTTIPQDITSYYTTSINVYSLGNITLQKDVGIGDLLILSKAVENNLYTKFSLYFTGTGQFSFRVTCEGNTESYGINIKKPFLKLHYYYPVTFT